MKPVKELMQEASGHLQKMLAGAGLLSKIKRFVNDDLPSIELFSSSMRDENKVLAVPGLDSLLDAFDFCQDGAVMHIKDAVESYSSEAYCNYLECMVGAYEAALRRPLSSDAQFMIVSSEYDAQHGALSTDGDGTMYFKLAQPSLDGVLLASKPTCSELLMSVRADYPDAKVVHVIEYLQSQLNDVQVQLDHVRAPSHEAAPEKVDRPAVPATFSQLDIDIHLSDVLILGAVNELSSHGFSVHAMIGAQSVVLSQDVKTILEYAYESDSVTFGVFSKSADSDPVSMGFIFLNHIGDCTQVIAQHSPELEPYLAKTLSMARAIGEGRFLEYCELSEGIGAYCDYSLSYPGLMVVDLREGEPDLSSARPFIADEIEPFMRDKVAEELSQWLPSQPGGAVILHELGIAASAGLFQPALNGNVFIAPEEAPALRSSMG